MTRSIAAVVVALAVVVAGAPGLATAGTGTASVADADAAAAVGSPGGDGPAQSAPTNETEENTTDSAGENDSVPPGAQLSGVVGAQGADLQGDVENRAFGHAMAAANSNASKASIVATQTRNLSQRLETLRERKQSLEAARANGSMSSGQYQARVARLAAQIRTVSRLANTTGDHARELPEAARRDRGVNVTAIDAISRNASEMSGPEVARIARTIRGGPPENVTRGPSGNATRGPHGGGGPPADVPTRTTNASDENTTRTNATGSNGGGPASTPGGERGTAVTNATTGSGGGPSGPANGPTNNSADGSNGAGGPPIDLFASVGDVVSDLVALLR